MSSPQPVVSSYSADALTSTKAAAQLTALSVDFLHIDSTSWQTAEVTQSELVIMLATSHEARLRLAIIPLLLRHPAFAADVLRVVAQLPPAAQMVLKCYYTAAQLLQQKYHTRLQALFGDLTPLPDLFSADLELPAFSAPDHGLQMLAECHRRLSGRTLNWLGTYEHGAQRLLTHCERRQLWQKSPSHKSEPG